MVRYIIILLSILHNLKKKKHFEFNFLLKKKKPARMYLYSAFFGDNVLKMHFKYYENVSRCNVFVFARIYVAKFMSASIVIILYTFFSYYVRHIHFAYIQVLSASSIVFVVTILYTIYYIVCVLCATESVISRSVH